jgi:pyruvate/2-oxoglutarate dehydrogenase complex dihydrolipoamide dehydrogenase (E3) component
MAATGFSNTVLEADYVIVGGGATGLVIASRLSEAGKDLPQDPRFLFIIGYTHIRGLSHNLLNGA